MTDDELLEKANAMANDAGNALLSRAQLEGLAGSELAAVLVTATAILHGRTLGGTMGTVEKLQALERRAGAIVEAERARARAAWEAEQRMGFDETAPTVQRALRLVH